nr:F420-dependent NADP oxidoreductase [uncultured Bacteroides sp.]
MKRSIEDTPIVFIGAGNLATNLAKALYRKGFRIVQVYSRTKESARTLADAVEAEFTTDLGEVVTNAELYIVSLTDSAFIQLLPQIAAQKEGALLVHTAGSLPMDVWQGVTPRYGVLYPMQTFSKLQDTDFSQIPFFIEACSVEDADFLKKIASILSKKVYDSTSEQRRSLHLAAVFTCNFTNHMYALAAELLQKYHLPFDAMLPLIDETSRKVHTLQPKQAQTGPALRCDQNVIDSHLAMLADEPQMQEIYRLLSEDIYRLANED